MRNIVQLDQYEYDKMVELAKLNESQIEKRATELWQEKGVAEVTIKVDAGTDYDDTYSIDCSTSMFYKDSKFNIPYELRERISKIIREDVMWNVEKKFGCLVKAINVFKRKSEDIDRAKYILWGIAASGWAACIAYMCFH